MNDHKQSYKFTVPRSWWSFANVHAYTRIRITTTFINNTNIIYTHHIHIIGECSLLVSFIAEKHTVIQQDTPKDGNGEMDMAIDFCPLHMLRPTRDTIYTCLNINQLILVGGGVLRKNISAWTNSRGLFFVQLGPHNVGMVWFPCYIVHYILGRLLR